MAQSRKNIPLDHSPRAYKGRFFENDIEFTLFSRKEGEPRKMLSEAILHRANEKLRMGPVCQPQPLRHPARFLRDTDRIISTLQGIRGDRRRFKALTSDYYVGVLYIRVDV